MQPSSPRRMVQKSGNLIQETPTKLHRHSVPNLSHALTSCTVKYIVVRKCLYSCGLSNSEVSDPTVFIGEHIFTARTAMDARLKCLRRFVIRRASVASIGTSSRYADVIRYFRVGLTHYWFWQSNQGIAHSHVR